MWMGCEMGWSDDRRASAMKGRGTHRLIPLEEDNAATLVTCCQVVASGVELDGRYDVGWMEMRIKNRRREREGDTLEIGRAHV